MVIGGGESHTLIVRFVYCFTSYLQEKLVVVIREETEN